MADGARASLRRLLVSGYDELRERLTRRLGSADVATEALNETWLRLEKGTEIAAVRDPSVYLYRMLINTAVDRRRADARWSTSTTLDEALELEDEQPSPERVVIARSQLEALERALSGLAKRTRKIFLAALVDELSYREIAKRFGISLRSVEREMGLAFEHCGERMKETLARGRPAVPRITLQADAARPRTTDADDDK